MQGQIGSINVSAEKGVRKQPVSDANLIAGFGVEGDAHAGSARQLSLLAKEAIDRVKSPDLSLWPGDFGENITTQDVDWGSLRIGQRLRLGNDAIIQISGKGKTCPAPCSIGKRLGECIMPREGMFAKVIRGGRIECGDGIAPTNAKVGAVVTLSDRCFSGDREDESGPVLIGLLGSMGVEMCNYALLPDNESALREQLLHLTDNCAVDIVLTTGGTGFSVRDRTPEATLSVITSPAPGIAEAIRHEGLQFTPYACISRGVSGLRGRTLIVNLPGSKRAVTQVSDFLFRALGHALDSLRMEVQDCGTIPQSPVLKE